MKRVGDQIGAHVRVMEDAVASVAGREHADVHRRQRSSRIGRHEEHGRWARAMKLTIGVQQEGDTRRK